MTFEHLMQAYSVDVERWTLKLVPQLMGMVQQGYTVMEPADVTYYEMVKSAILLRYEINAEIYYHCF